MKSRRLVARQGPPCLPACRSRICQRGVTLIEMIIVVAIIGMVTAGAAVAAYKYYERARLQNAASSARVLRGAVRAWWLHGHAGCPSVGRLIADRIVDDASSQRDPWQQEWRVVCDGDEVTVISNGPDREKDTDDDIRVPEASVGDS